MLDVGLTLEEDRQKAVEKLHSASDQELASSDELQQFVNRMKNEMMATSSGSEIPKKLRYGSSYPYRETDERLNIDAEQFGGSASFGQGGFSAVWGAGVLPFRDNDIEQWPINIDQLKPYYRKIFNSMDLTAEEDDLIQFFPLYNNEPEKIERSEQAQIILNSMADNRETLNGRGIYFGSSRLAIKSEGEKGCPHCGLKIFGCCPRGSVYDAADTLVELRNYDQFSYQNGVLVERVSEDNSKAVAHGQMFDTGQPVSYAGEKVFLACGVIPTTKILLRSLELYNWPVRMQETPYFILPMLTVEGANDVTSEDLNTLSQVFVEIFDEQLSDYSVHLQLYTYNELYEDKIRDTLGPLGHLPRSVLKPLLNRSVVAMGYMHSDHADGMRVTLDSDGEMSITGEISEQMRADVRRVARKLQRNTLSLGFLTLSPIMLLKDPGESFHLGGTFPMSKTPKVTETDTLGRPEGFDRVHAVDSTVFPTIPATTITASIMAMAYRIGDTHKGCEP